jgi:rRNA processing protein Gar1
MILIKILKKCLKLFLEDLTNEEIVISRKRSKRKKKSKKNRRRKKKDIKNSLREM